jgi:solute carrier family 35, member C2
MLNFMVLYFFCTLTVAMLLFALRKGLSYFPAYDTKAISSNIQLAAYTFTWYSISVTFTIFNKWFMTSWLGGFRYPILGTCVHMAVKLALTRVWYHFADDVIHPLSPSLRNKVVIPIGVVTALDIMFSNQAFLYVTVSEYTILKSSLVIFTFFWSIWYKLDTFRVQLLCAICIICGGLSLAVYSQLQDSMGTKEERDTLLIGVIYCVSAAACGGLRWTLTQVLIREDPQSSDVLVALYRFAPAAAVSILPFALVVDLPHLLQHDPVFNVASAPLLVMWALGLLIIGGCIAFALIFVEVFLLQLTSSVSMGVLGQMKEILQICVSLAVFSNEHLSLGAVVGVAVSLVGAYFYRRARMAFSASSAGRGSPMPAMELGEKGFFRRREAPGFLTGEEDDDMTDASELMMLQTYSSTPETKPGGASVRYTPLGQVCRYVALYYLPSVML